MSFILRWYEAQVKAENSLLVFFEIDTERDNEKDIKTNTAIYNLSWPDFLFLKRYELCHIQDILFQKILYTSV